MRAVITLRVPGTSSAGRARRRPCAAMYAMSPWQPAASQACKPGSAEDKSTPATPIWENPSSRAHAWILETN